MTALEEWLDQQLTRTCATTADDKRRYRASMAEAGFEVGEPTTSTSIR
ncbi:MAG: hypothetical protein M3443_19870 [Actinomycetota bacterium]|nr:hypothetical protein [Actinomycetota bacterium]